MMLRIGIKQPTNHPLVLRVVPLRFAFEELDATFTQRNGDLDPFVPKNEVFRAWEEIRNDLEVSEGFVCVPDSLAHRFAFLCAGNQPRRCG